MIKYMKGGLFSSPAQVLANTVNLDGVMGKGIALQFKKLYPDMFKCRASSCYPRLFIETSRINSSSIILR